MQIIRRTGALWPDIPCAACARIIHPHDNALILTAHGHQPIVLCEQDGQAIATEPDPTRLLEYLQLFP